VNQTEALRLATLDYLRCTCAGAWHATSTTIEPSTSPVTHLAHDDARARSLKIKSIHLERRFRTGNSRGRTQTAKQTWGCGQLVERALPWLFFARWTLNDEAIGALAELRALVAVTFFVSFKHYTYPVVRTLTNSHFGGDPRDFINDACCKVRCHTLAAMCNRRFHRNLAMCDHACAQNRRCRQSNAIRTKPPANTSTHRKGMA
jgi:hypothetical protein